ncbi:MAG: hypothetical protein GX935_04570 [Erysipelotrichia bacterium]|nr:hypothetical protein [Erysipelotrichia bacterium]
MRKNNKKLFSALIGILMIAILTVVFGSKLNAITNKNFELADGFQLVYQVDSEEKLTIDQVAEVLEQRLYNFGATEVKATIEESTVTLNYSGIEDCETVRKYLTMIGVVSFRNAADEELMDISVLDKDTPFMVAPSQSKTEESKDLSLLYILVSDNEKFKTVTTQLMFETSKYLVVWVDYDETYKFEKEQGSTSPKFLAAAAVNSVIDSDAYITSAHSFEVTKNIVATVNAGSLKAPITEISFNTVEANLGTNADVKVLIGIAVSVMLGSLYFMFKYKLVGFVSALMMLGYTIGSLVAISYLGVIFNTNIISLFIFSLFVGLAYLLHVNDTFVTILNTGRLPSTALETTYKNTMVNALAGLATQLIAGFIGFIAFKEYYLGYSIAIMTFAVCSAIFFVGWQKLMLSDLINSYYFDAKAFGYRENAAVKIIDFSALINTKFHYVVIALILMGALLYVTNVINHLKILLTGLFILVISVIVGGSYLKSRNKSNDLVILALTTITAVIAIMACGMLFGKTTETTIGLVYSFAAISLALFGFVLSQIKDDFDENAKGRLTDVKITSVFEEVFNNLFNETVVVLALTVIFALVIFGSVLSLENIGYTILVSVALIYAVIVMSKLWLDYTIKDSNRPKSKKKRNTKEVKERTIFGINNPN